MAHELETDGTRTAFVSARKDAWHRLGTVLDHAFTAKEAMEHAMLGGWNVRKATITAIDDDHALSVPGKVATVRTSPFTGRPEALGVVGVNYRPVQNEENCDILDALVDESGAHFETAGSLRGGRETFITMKLPSHLSIGGVDDIDVYLAALNSHDGSKAFRLMVTPVRIVCANTQAAAIRRARSSYSIRHTLNAGVRIAEAREALEITFRYLEGFQEEAERMIQEELAGDEFLKMVRDLWPGESTWQKDAREDTLMGLFFDADTQEQVRGTRWAGYQSVVEYLDHFSVVASKSKDKDLVRAERVLLSAPVEALKVRAFDLMKVGD